MFMFRNKRKHLIKELKQRARKQHEAWRSHEARTHSCAQTTALVADLVGVEEAFFDQLKINQLEMLAKAVDEGGQCVTGCVLLARERHPHVFSCQLFRWPDVRHPAELRCLPECHSASDPVYICCNPYHWSRLCHPDSSPPPYSHCAMDSLKPEDRAPSEAPIVCRDSFIGSLTTSGEDSSMSSRSWCKLAYWELKRRVGQQVPVEPTHLNIFGDIPRGDGLSLTDLAQHSFTPPDSVRKIRCKIGLGVTLSREADGIWVYNRSEHPIFVNSLTLLDPISSPVGAPTRVPAEHCICVFDPERAAHQAYGWGGFADATGPIDRNSVQISFAKGWGSKYSRQNITCCPCWLEVLLEPCR